MYGECNGDELDAELDTRYVEDNDAGEVQAPEEKCSATGIF